MLAGKGIKRGGKGVVIAGEGVIRDGDGVIRAGDGVIRVVQDFKCRLILQLILKYKNIIKKNLNLMVFIQEIIYIK